MVRIHIRGRALSCSLGDDIDQIIARVKNREVVTVETPIRVAGLDYTRPYYRLPAQYPQSLTDLERFFFDLLYRTVSRAVEDAGLSEEELSESAIFFGSTSIDMPMVEWTYRTTPDDSSQFLSEKAPGYGRIAAGLAERFHVRGPCYTLTTACTSSANGLMYAANLIQAGRIPRAIVIGYDIFNELGFFGFESLKLIEPFGYKPFDKNRIGIIMGEGCGVAILDGRRPGKTGFTLLGGSNACDTFNVTTHNVDGSDIAWVIGDALSCCGLEPDEIDAVKAHATGSPMNDLTEYNGMKRAFGDRIPPFTGVKPYVGHTVGACGVIEMIIIAESVGRGFFPATPGFQEIDDEIGAAPITDHMPIERGTFMLNYFGFGGNCTSLIITNGV